MTKKKAPASGGAKAARARAGAAANPVKPQEVAEAPKPPKAASVSSAPPAARPPFRRPQLLNFAGVGRNDICPCGSGKRFKNCHGH